MRKLIEVPLLIIFSLWRDVLAFLWRPVTRFLWNFSSSKGRASRPRILIIKLGQLNEAVHMMPALSFLKKEFPDAHLTFLGSQQIATFLTKAKLVDRIEIFSFQTFWEMTKANYMLVMDFEIHSRLSAMISSMMKTPTSIGFETKGEFRHFTYDVAVAYNSQIALNKNFWNLAHEAAQACGHNPPSKFFEELKQLREVLKDQLYQNALKNIQIPLPQEFVVFNLAAKDGARQWTQEKWLELLQAIKQQHPQTEFFLSGDVDHGEYEDLKAAGAKSWIDKLSFDELFQIFYKAKKIYSVDNELITLAYYLNDDVTILLGPTNEIQFSNFDNLKIIKSNLACAPCNHPCKDPVCMKAIDITP